MSRTVIVQVDCDECGFVFDEADINVVTFRWGKYKPVNLDLCTPCKDEATAMFKLWLNKRPATETSAGSKTKSRQDPTAPPSRRGPAATRPAASTCCPICDKDAASEGLMNHISAKHRDKDGQVRCPKCTRKLSHPRGLLIHMGRDHSSKKKGS